jgi:hypothetical protein
MNEPLFTDHFGHLPSHTEEWTSSRATRDCSTPNSLTRRHGESDTPYLQDHHQVSPFELALNYNSSLNTPASINPRSPSTREAPSSDSQWCRSNSSLQYHQRGNDTVYIPSNSIPMKSRENSSPVRMSGAEIPISISPYIFESPSTQCPPSPYWGSFSVSDPQTTTTASPHPNSTPQSQTNISASSRSQAPALAITHSMNTHLAARQHQAQQVQAQQTHQQGQTLQVKRECPTSSPRAKRRKKSPSESRVSPGGPLTTSDLTEADKLLLHLKDIKEEEKWDWKEITTKFNEITKGDHKVAALQMRHTRLVERMRIWTDTEVHSLYSIAQTHSFFVRSSLPAPLLPLG